MPIIFLDLAPIRPTHRRIVILSTPQPLSPPERAANVKDGDDMFAGAIGVAYKSDNYDDVSHPLTPIHLRRYSAFASIWGFYGPIRGKIQAIR